MKTRLVVLATSLAAALACGKPPPPPPDAGVDTSCGIDCVAQQKYGLIVDRCFEYSDTLSAQQFPSLGVRVRPVKELEGGLKVIPMDYLQGGIIRMSDHFALVDGALVLARRTWPSSGDSVNYRDASGNIVGVTWWERDTGANQNFSTSVTADVIDGGMRTSVPTTYGVSTVPASGTEQNVPFGSFDTAVKMILDENPPHGTDGKRVFVEGTGFTLFSTSFDLAQTGGTEYRLQNVRDIGSADGGTHECGSVM